MAPTPEDLDNVLQNLKARVQALEASKADYHALVEAITAFGDTQQMLADVLRGFGSEMRSTAEDSNERIRALEASTAEIKTLMAKTLEH